MPPLDPSRWIRAWRRSDVHQGHSFAPRPDDEVRILDAILAVMAYDRDGQLRDFFDSSGRIPVVTQAESSGTSYAEYSDAPLDNTDAAVSIAAGQVHELIEVVPTVVCDATVASRTMDLAVTYARVAASGFTDAVVHTLTTLTLTASEQGRMIYNPSWGDKRVIVTEDAGVFTVVTTATPGPIVLIGQENYQSRITANKQVGDRLGLSVVTLRRV